MGKVKITKEQAKMIDNHKDSFELLMSKRHNKHCQTFIDDMSVEDVLSAYFDGYEVIDEFKVKDWIKDECIGVVQIQEIDEVGFWIGEKYEVRELRYKHQINKKATPEEIAEEKQRRFWAKHDRKVWELKEGDVLTDKDKHSCVVKFVEGADETGVLLVDCKRDEWFEPEDLHVLNKKYVMFCFAEDRLDDVQ